jgi:SAM-dependent methyltransferase
MTGFDRETLEFYTSQAKSYLGYRPNDVNSDVREFLKLLPPKARVLELGCGGGADAEYMIAQGFDVDPTDGVIAMAAEAEARLGRTVRVMRFDELDTFETYNAVIASASLLHVPVAGLAPILTRIWRALKPGGWHLATYKTAGRESRDKYGRYYNYLSQDEADRQYRAAGNWMSVDYDQQAGVGYFSAPARWLKVVAKKAA